MASDGSLRLTGANTPESYEAIFMGETTVTLNDKGWNGLTDPNMKRGVKIRLAHVFKKEGQTSMDIMGEIKLLSGQDLADFCTMFCEAGYPTEYVTV